MLPETFLEATAFLEKTGPWLLGIAAVASLGLFLSTASDLFRRRTAAQSRERSLPERILFPVVLAALVGAFALLVWYHYRIWRDLPLTVPSDVGEWINTNLAALARQGRGGLPPVDWGNPPRYLIPLWIEGEKFFFWSLVYGFGRFCIFCRLFFLFWFFLVGFFWSFPSPVCCPFCACLARALTLFLVTDHDLRMWCRFDHDDGLVRFLPFSLFVLFPEYECISFW